jgi:hypothetical protein
MVSRLNVSVSEDLKARMDAMEGVNWSRIAARAFEEKLRENQDASARKLALESADAIDEEEPIETLVGIVRESRPELEAEVRENIGPVYARWLDRKHMVPAYLAAARKFAWPINSAAEFAKAVDEFLLIYHETVTEPLLAKVVQEVVMVRLEGIAQARKTAL